MTYPLFDTHAHLISDDWETYRPRPMRPDLPVPARTDYTVTADTLIELMDENGVATACVVQRGHLYGYDNSYIIDSSHRHPRRFLPVVILDAQDPATPARFAGMVKNDGVRGFRMAQSRPWRLDTAWMSSPEALEVWKVCAELGTPMNIILFRNQLPYVLPLLKIIAKRFSDLPILIDHLGLPCGMSRVELKWADEAGDPTDMPPPPDFGLAETIGIFEDTPNIHFKLTEINMENLADAGAEPAQLVRRMADVFGAERLMWGSDVGQSTRWSYPEKVAMGKAAADLLSDEERGLFLHDNAARVYGCTA
ncbi:MAG TPA: amidohydrolase family protein [Gammaproteobacteria bacterium]